MVGHRRRWLVPAIAVACYAFRGHFGTDARAAAPDGPANVIVPQTHAGHVSTQNRGDLRATSRIHPTLLRRLREAGEASRVKAWVLFADKGFGSQGEMQAALRDVASRYDRRAVERRRKRRSIPGLFDLRDLPVAQRYLDAVAAFGVELRVTSKWVNGVSVVGTKNQFDRIAELPFVRMIQPVRRGVTVYPRRVEEARALRSRTEGSNTSAVETFYGQAEAQLAQMNLIAVHNLGFTGAGVIIGVLDTGFQRSHAAFNDSGHPISVVAEYDFINNDANTGIEPSDPSSQHAHGTMVLSTLGGYQPGEYVAAAYDASFILCKTEDLLNEYPAEEDNYVAGLEFIEANGGDVATSSLGYIDWYTQDDLDGLTAVTTVAVNVATANGVYCCTAAGNSGHDADPATSHLLAPADAMMVLSCGAVDSDGATAPFSSDGPTADGRLKPEVLARGVGTRTIDPWSDAGYVGGSGTSFSTPLVAGAVACLVQAHPEWTVDEMRRRLFYSAGDYVVNGSFDPTYVRGYGVIDALAALTFVDCNNNNIDDQIDVATGTSADTNGNGVPDECEAGGCCLCPPDTGCLDTNLADCNDRGGYFARDAVCANLVCPESNPINDACDNAAVVTAGVYAFDTRCATTDGPPTATGDCGAQAAGELEADIWFQYVATCSYRMSVTVLDADYDAMVAVYCDGTSTCSCPNDASTEYACGRTSGNGSLVGVPVTAGNCYTIRVGGLSGEKGTGRLEVACEEPMCFLPAAPQLPPGSVDKNRFLSFQAGDAGRIQAVRVTLEDMPPPLDVRNGETFWVGEPRDVTELAGATDPSQAPGWPTFKAAALQCQPHFMDWSTVGTVHVYDDVVVPNATFAVQVADSDCFILPTMCSEGYGPVEDAFSDPLLISTSIWGDIVEDCATNPCGAPDGRVTVAGDVLAVLDKFKNLPGSPIKPRCDLAGLEPTDNAPDMQIAIIDVTYCLTAFTGGEYPFAPTGDPCP